MPGRITNVLHFAARVVVVPFLATGISEGRGELEEQAFMDRIFAKRNLVRFVFLATTAALFLEAVLA